MRKPARRIGWVLVVSMGLAAAAAAGELSESELRISTPFWSVAVFPDIVGSAEAASATSIVVDERTFEILRSPAPNGHHQHF
jgi:hypothetical protein